MKFLIKASLFCGFITATVAGKITAFNYEITHYGGSDDNNSELHPACENSLGSYYAALSTRFDWKSNCDQYAVVMLTNGSKKMVKAKIVDSCGSCDKYHVDLSKKAFTSLQSKSKGVGNVIWGIYSKSGKKLSGPYENKASSAASEFNLSKSAFISAFDANASKLASSSSYTKDFEVSVSNKVTTTTTTTTTTTIAKTTTKIINTTLPVGATTTKLPIRATTTMGASTTAKVAEKPKPTNPTKNKVVSKAIEETNGGSSATVGIAAAIGGGVLGAAGLGLVFMKKKNPNQYEDLKQKFPEAFTQVKRGLSRSATQLKRKMTRKAVKPLPQLNENNDYAITV